VNKPKKYHKQGIVFKSLHPSTRYRRDDILTHCIVEPTARL